MGFLSYLLDALIAMIDGVFYLPNLVLVFLTYPSAILSGLEATATILGLMMTIVSDPLIFPLYLQLAFSFRVTIWFSRLAFGYIKLVWDLLPFF